MARDLTPTLERTELSLRVAAQAKQERSFGLVLTQDMHCAVEQEAKLVFDSPIYGVCTIHDLLKIIESEVRGLFEQLLL